MRHSKEFRRVAVTGVGLVTPIGVGVKRSWNSLISNVSGVRRTGVLIGSPGGGKEFIGGIVSSDEVRERFLEYGLNANDRASGTKVCQFALLAAAEAVKDSGIEPLLRSGAIDPRRAGVTMATAIGSCVDEIIEAQTLVSDRGIRRLSPYFIPRVLPNMPAGHISIRYNLQGPNHSVSTACAAGAHSLGDAARFIAFGDADVMVAGSSESTVNTLTLGGFSRMKALSTKFDHAPEESSRPFDEKRDGFVMGEGAGVVILEELESARLRGAKIYAELSGYGLSADASHITAPSEDGRGAINAMNAAVSSAQLSHSLIDYVNAHATSTPVGDSVELAAIASVFGRHSGEKVKVSSTKGHTGHLLGAAGTVEAIFTILSIFEGVLPSTLNLSTLGEADKKVLESVTLLQGSPLKCDISHAISNSFGFGGTNASLVFSKLK